MLMGSQGNGISSFPKLLISRNNVEREGENSRSRTEERKMKEWLNDREMEKNIVGKEAE
jgi:hypothetical protein